MTTNRSTEELATRDLLVPWGRRRWHGARVVHELVVGEKRIDLAFIGKDQIAGVEIKGPKDKLDRLAGQIATFSRVLPEFWLAYHPKWYDHIEAMPTRDLPYGTGRVAVDPNDDSHMRLHVVWGQTGQDRAKTVPLLELLWRGELMAVAARTRVNLSKRDPIGKIIPELARHLTGNQIVREVCRELRNRDAFPAFPESDPPMGDKA